MVNDISEEARERKMDKILDKIETEIYHKLDIGHMRKLYYWLDHEIKYDINGDER